MLRGDLYDPWFKDEKWGLVILRDQFKDVALQINNIEFSRTNESSVDLDYEVINLPDTVTEDDTKSTIFNELMSVIISDVLTEAVKIHQDEQSRADNSQESS